MQDARTLSQRAKVQLVRDEALSRFLPARVTDVQITLADGSPLTERVEAVRGTPRNPMSSAEIIAKARNLVEPVLGPSKSAHLIDTVFAIEKLASVRDLRPLLQTT